MIVALSYLFFPLMLTMNNPASANASKSGDDVTQERKIENFNKIEVSGAYHVQLTQGNAVNLKVVGDIDAQDDLITEVVNGTLKIHRRKGVNWSWKDRKSAKVYLTVKDLNRIEATGASKVEGQNLLKTSKLDIDVSGASSVSLAIETDKLDADISGASKLKLKGSATNQDVDVSGAGSYRAFDLASTNADVDVSGASKATISVSDNLTAEASGAAKILYKGSPKSRDIESSGGSSIKQMAKSDSDDND